MTVFSAIVAVVSGFVLFVLGPIRRRKLRLELEVEQDPAVVRRRRESLRRGTIQMTVVFVLAATAALGFGAFGAILTVLALFMAPSITQTPLSRPWVWRGSAVVLGLVAFAVTSPITSDMETLVIATEPPGITAPSSPGDDSVRNSTGGVTDTSQEVPSSAVEHPSSGDASIAPDAALSPDQVGGSDVAHPEALPSAAEQPPGIAAGIPPETESSTDQVGDAALAEEVVEPVTPQAEGGAQTGSPAASAATASNLPATPAVPVQAAPPPVRNLAFTIESHPVTAPIYVSTNPAREAQRNLGNGSVTISVAPGTEITYSIRPSNSSGFEPFYGRLTVQQEATHPVWLTPRPRVTPPNVAAYPANSPERAVGDWFAAYAREDWNAMVSMTLPSQLRSGRQTVFNGIEGTYFFREYRQLVTLNRASGDDVVAHINVVWEHDLGRSSTRIMVIRENAAGHPDRSASWKVSYLSAMGVRDAQ